MWWFLLCCWLLYMTTHTLITQPIINVLDLFYDVLQIVKYSIWFRWKVGHTHTLLLLICKPLILCKTARKLVHIVWKILTEHNYSYSWDSDLIHWLIETLRNNLFALEKTLEIFCNTFQRNIVFGVALNSAFSHVNNECPERRISSEIFICHERFYDSLGGPILKTILAPLVAVSQSSLFTCLRPEKLEFI